jgi:hypothetical protein
VFHERARIGEEADVEHQVGLRCACFEGKGRHDDLDLGYWGMRFHFAVCPFLLGLMLYSRFGRSDQRVLVENEVDTVDVDLVLVGSAGYPGRKRGRYSRS